MQSSEEACKFEFAWDTLALMQAEIHHLESNDHIDWNDFVRYQSPDPYDDYGWFQLTIGASGVTGGEQANAGGSAKWRGFEMENCLVAAA